MFVKGQVVKALKGRDQNRFFVVLDAVEPDRVLMADGDTRSQFKPKCKNIKHLEGTDVLLDLENIHSDKALRRILQDATKTLK